VFREKITGTTADRPQLRALMRKLAPGDVVITPAVDRLSRDTTDLLVIARDMQRAGAGIRSLAEPFLDWRAIATWPFLKSEPRNQLRTRLPAGGRWIRTIGTPQNFLAAPSIPPIHLPQ
jgi:hypothetical protein